MQIVVKILHVPFTFHPDPVGGTEVYVEGLARAQQAQGFDAIVAAPGDRKQTYDCSGLKVWRFPVGSPIQDIRELYGDGDQMAAQEFAEILKNERPNVVHLHAFTRGASLRLVRVARQLGISLVFSYHTPTVSCQRGTLLRWGSEACDGVLDTSTCAQCSLNGLGVNRALSVALGHIPTAVGRFLGAAGATGGLWTALRMTELVSLRHQTFRSLVTEVDHIVALCKWVKDVLVCNGVGKSKVTVSRQGVSPSKTVPTSTPRLGTASPLRLVFFGRLDPTKGVHVVIEAMRSVPNLRVTFDIYAISQDACGAVYPEYVHQAVKDDARIRFRHPIPAEDVVDCMRQYDVLVVPSQSLETGPMVVMEAFAAGLPVIGSNLGGIAELVRHGVDGLLVEPRSKSAWCGTLAQLSENPTLVLALRTGVRPPRTMTDAAADMSTVYAQLVPGRESGPSSLA
jgi:glycosyltransferase involved in cell wall biosynthesis